MESKPHKKLIIIPTYNEKENIENIVRKTFTVTDSDILVIDDGSPDGTAAIVKNLIQEFPDRLFIEERTGKLGLGTAYSAGFRWALVRKYDYIFEMDADFSHNTDDVERLYTAILEQGADMAIGSRYCQGVNVLNWPMSRLLMSYYGSMYVRFILGLPVRDTTAGFVCYSYKVLDAIDLSKIKHIGYGFQIEMKFNAHKLHFKIVEVPIIFKDRTLGTSKMSAGIFKEAVFGVISMKINSFFRKWERLPEI
jgi:dolichol-phosphate mannosyltransferase